MVSVESGVGTWTLLASSLSRALDYRDVGDDPARTSQMGKLPSVEAICSDLFETDRKSGDRSRTRWRAWSVMQTLDPGPAVRSRANVRTLY